MSEQPHVESIIYDTGFPEDAILDKPPSTEDALLATAGFPVDDWRVWPWSTMELLKAAPFKKKAE